MSGLNTPHYLLVLDMKKKRPPQVLSRGEPDVKKGPLGGKNERNANDPKGGLCCGYTFSENSWIFPILLCVLILSHLFKISFVVFLTEKSEQD